MRVSGVALLVAAVGGKHIGEHGLAVDGLIESLRGPWAVRIFGRVLLVDLRFLLRALGQTLPVAAELVVDQREGGQIGRAGVRIELDDLLQLLLVHLVAHVGIALPGRGARGGVGPLQLPENVRCPPHRLGDERRLGKHLDEAPVEQPRALRCVHRAARVAGQRFLIGRLAHQHLVAVGRSFDDHPFGLHPAGDWRRHLVAAELGGVFLARFLNVGVGVDAQPGAAVLGDDHLAANLHAVHFLRAGIGRDIEPGNTQRRGARAGHRLFQLRRLGGEGVQRGASQGESKRKASGSGDAELHHRENHSRRVRGQGSGNRESCSYLYFRRRILRIR